MREGPVALPGVTTTSTSSKIDWIRAVTAGSASRRAAMRSVREQRTRARQVAGARFEAFGVSLRVGVVADARADSGAGKLVMMADGG